MIGNVRFKELSLMEFKKNLAEKAAGGQAELLHYTAFQKENGNWTVIAVTGHKERDDTEWLKTVVPKAGQLNSLSIEWPAALWLEREIYDKTDLAIANHPDLRTLLHPEKNDLHGIARGSGTFHLPLGPVRGDVTESLLFHFDILGEQIMFLESQLFYKYRRIESLVRGKKPEYGLLLAERIAGTSTVAHAAAFISAVEQALKLSVNIRTVHERLLLGEMERLYNHAGDLALLAGATGMTVGQAQLARIKEELLWLNANLCGSRYLRGAIHLGSASNIDWGQKGGELINKLKEIARRFKTFTALLALTPTFIDRLKGTGRIEKRWVRAFDLVGPVARGIGSSCDIRLNYFKNNLELDNWSVTVDRQGSGDAFSRFNVRVEEWWQSLRLMEFLVEKLAKHDWGLEPWFRKYADSPLNWGHGIVESPRGRTSHIVYLDDEGNIDFWNIRSASGTNWPVFGLATANGNIQTDFPIIEASFALNVASCDR